jgi:hypothetical protein
MATSLIPETQRFGNLKQYLFDFAAQVAAARNQSCTFLEPRIEITLTFLISADAPNMAPLTEDQKAAVEIAKRRLEEIRAADVHLRACCPTISHLAYHFDNAFISFAADVIRGGGETANIETAYLEFEGITYGQGTFQRLALSHLFNFEMD